METDNIGGVLSRSLSEIDSVVFAYLFGSRAEGRFRSTSDIDVATYVKENSDFAEEKLLLIGRLGEALKTDDLDVVILNTAPIALVGRILHKNKLLVDRDPYLRQAFESLSVRKFMDFSVKERAILNQRFGLGR